MMPIGVENGRLSPRDGRLGPRGLRRGAMTPEQRSVRDEIITIAKAACEGNPARALGLLAGCVYELAFRISDAEGPPDPARRVHGAVATVVGSIVFQPTSAILAKVSTYFSVEAANFLKWKGEHVEIVRDRIGEAAHQLGVDLGDDVLSAEARAPENEGQPVTEAEFDEVLFRRRVHEIVGRALRAHPFGMKRTVELLFVSLVQALELLADEHVHEAASSGFSLGKHLDRLAKRFQVGSYRTQAHWADDPAEADRLSGIADRLEQEYSK